MDRQLGRNSVRIAGHGFRIVDLLQLVTAALLSAGDSQGKDANGFGSLWSPDGSGTDARRRPLSA